MNTDSINTVGKWLAAAACFGVIAFFAYSGKVDTQLVVNLAVAGLAGLTGWHVNGSGSGGQK